jgi:hypothetical protein
VDVCQRFGGTLQGTNPTRSLQRKKKSSEGNQDDEHF